MNGASERGARRIRVRAEVSENYRANCRYRGSPGVRILPCALEARRGLDRRCAQHGCAVLPEHLRAKQRGIRRGCILRREGGRRSDVRMIHNFSRKGRKVGGESGRRARAPGFEPAPFGTGRDRGRLSNTRRGEPRDAGHRTYLPFAGARVRRARRRGPGVEQVESPQARGRGPARHEAVGVDRGALAPGGFHVGRRGRGHPSYSCPKPSDSPSPCLGVCRAQL